MRSRLSRAVIAGAAFTLIAATACSSPTAPTPSPTKPGDQPGAVTPRATSGNTTPSRTDQPLAALEPFFLTVVEPKSGMVVNSATARVRGLASQDAVLTVNGAIVSIGVEGNWATDVPLVEGPNAIEVIASDFFGSEKMVTLAVIQVP